MKANTFQALKRACEVLGIRFVSGYSGYMASNFLSQFPNVVQAINETSAISMAHVSSYLGTRSLVIMKNAGLNEGALPFRNACDLGINAGMIIVFTDDITADMSENQQDSRNYYELGKTLLLEPKSPKELYDMAKEAVKLSERFKLPILIRITNALNNSKWKEEIPKERTSKTKTKRAVKNQNKWVLHPKTADSIAKIHKNKFKKVLEYVEESRFNTISGKGKSTCVYSQALVPSEIKRLSKFDEVIRVGTFPIPYKKVQKVLKDNKEVTIIDTGEGFLEEEIKESYGYKIKFKSVIRNYPHLEIKSNNDYAPLWKMIKERNPSFVCGDFGSYTLSKGSPIEYALHYGSSLFAGVGASLAKQRKIYVITGDGAFTSGIEGLFEAIRKKIQK